MKKPISRNLQLAVLTLVSLLSFNRSFGTHIRAGEISVTRLDNISLRYEFTITGFRDTGSSILFGGGIFLFGDGQSATGPFVTNEAIPVGNGIELVSFTLEHTYDSQNGNGYLVSYSEEFRNADIINMANSVGTTFYVEALVVIDFFYGVNNSPILTVPPIDFAAVGAKFIHNPGAYDPDGDSLSYSFTIPKQERNGDVNGYRSLIDPSFYSTFATGSEEGGIPTLTLNPITGDLIWDAPGDAIGANDAREYNVAFIITEWRTFAGQPVQIGYVVRDMQIIVEITNNERPNLEVPDDRCVEAGQNIHFDVIGTDPDGQQIKMEAFGGPFEINNPATYQVSDEFQDTPAVLTFDWNTTCGHVRQRPYEVQFKATDKPMTGPRLVNFESMEITVVGPAPTGLTTSVQPGKSIRLSWDQYSCPSADRIQIWRKVGNSDITVDECTIGMPPNTGFEKIDEVSVTTTTYLDTNDGIGLPPGGLFCYRLVAAFPFPEGGASYVSAESCDSVLIDVPVITNVDITTTSETQGSIFVRWTPPYQIDEAIYPPNYTYDLFRVEGQKAKLDETVTPVMLVSGTTDTTFNDTGLNTLNQAYTYFVRFYASGISEPVDTSAFASSIRLSPKPLVQAIELSWEGVVPWSLRSLKDPFHYIYRDQVLPGDPDQLVLIDSINVANSGLIYLDDGSFNDEALDEEIEYCYYVETYGTYDNILLPEPLINRTQIGCAEPNDSIPPCRPPVVLINEDQDCKNFFTNKECGFSDFSNRIEWTVDADPNCDNDIQFYNVYFSESGADSDYVIVGKPVSTVFIHDDLASFKGCYRISSVDRSGNESGMTDPVCIDNCPNYELPNAFSPNGDGINDLFTPYFSDPNEPIAGFNPSNCPRFVKDVEFFVFDRTGNKVYEYLSLEGNKDILINWNGKNQLGIALAAGTYFYEVKVTFDVLDSKKSKQIFKGWVQIVR